MSMTPWDRAPWDDEAEHLLSEDRSHWDDDDPEPPLDEDGSPWDDEAEPHLGEDKTETLLCLWQTARSDLCV